MLFIRSTLFLVALTLICKHAVADIILSIDNATVTPGDAFTLEVRVQGDMTYDALTERLDFFVSLFRIAPVGSASAGSVRFDDPQANGFDTDTDYLFFNNTSGLTREVTTDPAAQDTLTIADGTADSLGVDVTNSFLLARLELTANPGLLDVTQYQVSLVDSESQFQNENFDSIGFSSTGGLISVNGPTSIPEPNGLLLISSIAGCAGFGYRRRKPCSDRV